MDALSLNIRLRLQQQIAHVEKVWTTFRAVLSFYGQQERFDILDQCVGSINLSVKELVSLPESAFDICLKQVISVPPTGSTITRRTRGINIVSRLLGDGDELIRIENSLSGAINTFNSDFKRVENFTHQVKSSLQLLDEELFTLLKSEGKIKSHMIDLEMELVAARNRMEYVIIKLQHLESINQMLKETRLPETLDLLERGALHRNICHLKDCETGIHTTSKNDSIFLHRTLVSLIPVQRFLIECRAVSSFKISIYHNSVATKTSMENYLINTTLVSELDLSNETVVNKNLRTLKESELHLNVFNIYGRNLQCLKEIEFSLNGKLLSCNSLDVFLLPPEYVVSYGKRKISEHKIERQGQKKVLQTWIGSYSFDNFLHDIDPDLDAVVSLIHPSLDDYFFEESGNINVTNASIFTGSTILLGLSCTMLFCCLCKPYRQCTVSLCTRLGAIMYKGCTTKKYRNQKEEEKQIKKIDEENQELREDNEKSRITLEKSVRANKVLDEALRILGMDMEDINHLVDVDVTDHNTQHGEKKEDVKKNTGEKKEDIKKKNDVKHAESQRKFVTFSSADSKAVAHLGDGRGEKSKIKQ